MRIHIPYRIYQIAKKLMNQIKVLPKTILIWFYRICLRDKKKSKNYRIVRREK